LTFNWSWFIDNNKSVNKQQFYESIPSHRLKFNSKFHLREWNPWLISEILDQPQFSHFFSTLIFSYQEEEKTSFPPKPFFPSAPIWNPIRFRFVFFILWLKTYRAGCHHLFARIWSHWLVVFQEMPKMTLYLNNA
jgi:hypothetical protein